MILPGFAIPVMAMAGGGLPDPGAAYEGGYFMGTIVDPDAGGGEFALIVAPKATGQAASAQSWGGNGADSGADSDTNGPANTAALVSEGGHAPANYCAGLSIDGYEDWYLPAIDELVVIYANRDALPGGELFDTTFAYWSSTEASISTASGWRFSNGTLDNANKGNFLPTRAIRRVAI